MNKLFEKLAKLDYPITNKRVIGNPEHTSPETREKDLIQEYALIVMWLYKKHGVWIEITMGKDHNQVWFDYDIFSTIKPRKDDLTGEENIEYKEDPNEKWLNYRTTYDSMINPKFEMMEKENYPSPTEAYEAAIEYCLNNLI